MQSSTSKLYADLKALKAQIETIRREHAAAIACTVHVLRAQSCTIPVQLKNELKDIAQGIDDAVDTYEGAHLVGLYAPLKVPA